MRQRPSQREQWDNVRTVAERALLEVLLAPRIAARERFSGLEADYLARRVEDLVAAEVLSPLLLRGQQAWEALAADLESDLSWRGIAAKWVSPRFPAALQSYLWGQQVPYAGGAGLRLREALERRRWHRQAPKDFGKRLVCYVTPRPGGWGIVRTEFEPASPGDEVAVRVEVVKSHEQQP